MESLTPPLNPHFGRRCFDTFSRCSTNKSTSMDVISEREDSQNSLSISLSLSIIIHKNWLLKISIITRVFIQGSNLVQETPRFQEKFRSRASTEGSLSYHKRYSGTLSNDSVTVAGAVPRVSTVRRMSISLRGAVSTFWRKPTSTKDISNISFFSFSFLRATCKENKASESYFRSVSVISSFRMSAVLNFGSKTEKSWCIRLVTRSCRVSELLNFRRWQKYLANYLLI